MDVNDAAPIALFVYDRPEHTRATVEALARNEFASQSELFIFSDAPRTPEKAAAVSEVRRYVRTVSGFRATTLIERLSNYGLARSITEGVTQLCEERGRAIVVEDDLVTSQHFLRFMNEALNAYEDSERVMHISGCRYPIPPFGTAETFFLRLPLCWGWATWRRAWRHLERDAAIMDRFNPEAVRQFDFDGTYPYWEQLESNRAGVLETWFAFWYASIYLRGGLALFPSRSLVRNIGFDGSGVHCRPTTAYDVAVSIDPVRVGGIAIEESREAVEQHKLYFRRLYPGLRSRLFRLARKFVRGQRFGSGVRR